MDLFSDSNMVNPLLRIYVDVSRGSMGDMDLLSILIW